VLRADNGSPRLAPGLYQTGWIRRGPIGAIAENRTCAREVAAVIAEDLAANAWAPSPAGPDFAALAPTLRTRSTDFSAWKRLDAAEVAAAPPGRIRQKVSDRERMVHIAREES
jgi:ferredoxin--NADP+ reductase